MNAKSLIRSGVIERPDRTMSTLPSLSAGRRSGKRHRLEVQVHVHRLGDGPDEVDLEPHELAVLADGVERRLVARRRDFELAALEDAVEDGALRCRGADADGDGGQRGNDDENALEHSLSPFESECSPGARGFLAAPHTEDSLARITPPSRLLRSLERKLMFITASGSENAFAGISCGEISRDAA